MYKNNILIPFFIAIFLSSCSSYKPQYAEQNENYNGIDETIIQESEIEKSFYLVGDAGNANLGESTGALKAFSNHIKNTITDNDYAIFLGDNIYEKGMPPKNDKNRELAEHRMNVQIESVKNFNGEVIFIPGNHDWYNEGLSGLKRQEKYVEKALKNKDAFQPENGCPIKKN